MTKYDFPAAGDYPVTVYQKGFGVQEFPQTYTLRILPGLNPGRGKKINIGLADSGFVEKCLTPAEFKTVWETLAESGMNYILTDSYNGYQECCKFMRERNISTAWCQFMHHDATLKDIVAKHPESRHVNPVCPQPEWRLKSMMCPLAFMELPEVDAAHKELVTHFDWIMFDTENGVKSACLCERCRREFAKQFKLPETPDAKTIYEKYEKELLSFQIGMLRKVITFQMGLARKYNPEIKTSIYSGYAYPANMTAYGVDWSLYRDIDYPSAGYDLSSSIIAGTRKEIGGDPMICGFFPSTNLFENPRPDQNIKGRLFQLLRDGGFMGTFVFAWQEIDGRGLTALADFSRGCAAFGDMLMEKYQIPAENIVSGMSGDAVTAHKQNGKYLVLAVNLSPSPRKLRITPPDDLKNAAAWDFYKNTKTPVSGAFTAEVPANDASLILMEGK
jgi:hypothetical protein